MEESHHTATARSRGEAREVARRRASLFELHSGIPAQTAQGKTVCRQFFQKASCAFGSECKFAHVEGDEREELLQRVQTRQRLQRAWDVSAERLRQQRQQ